MMAGYLGMDWRPMTLVELYVSWQARLLACWDETAAIMWTIRDSKSKRRLKYANFHPYRRKSDNERVLIRGKVDIGMFAKAFMSDVLGGR